MTTSSRVVEEALADELTGTDIARLGGLPQVGVGTELMTALVAACTAMGPNWPTDRQSEVRWRRLNALIYAADVRRRARQCARLGYPAKGAEYLRRCLPYALVEQAIWRAYGRAEIEHPFLTFALAAIKYTNPKANRLKKWKWFSEGAGEAFPSHLRDRINRYFDDADAG
jgi:hypothetical protein